jgi:hypothetical protein
MIRLKRFSYLMTALLCLMSIQMMTPLGIVLADPAPNKLFIDILDGEGALNDVRARTAREPVVQVEDENHKPVAGALVLFSLPSSGPSATFTNALTTFSVTTGADGKATALGFKPNNVGGQYQIQVSASFGSLTTVAVINETNVVAASNGVAQRASSRAIPLKVLVIGGAILAGGITAAVLATGGHSDTVTAGAPSVGPPAPTNASIR